MFLFDSVACVDAVLAGKTGERINLKAALSIVGSRPLHQAARHDAFKLIALFLDKGEIVNERIDFKELNLKQALPLVALANMRASLWMKDWMEDKSPFRLLVYLSRKTEYLESVRLLAQKTKEIDQITSGYLKEGKMIELGSLLMVGCKPSVTPRLQFDSEEPEKVGTLLLLEIFQKIGDKITAYIQLKRPNSITIDRRVIELASLFEDAGFQVKSREAAADQSLMWRLKTQVCRPHMSGRPPFPRGCAIKSQGSVVSLRPFHSSAPTLKSAVHVAYPVQTRSSANVVPKTCFWKGLVTTFQRGLRHL